mmetsp:Transcript_7954/g.20468  ORF Transcript_7954/g.20468 Transcript_7954/m.20468 type:complete len:314 (+) Transcript_7954:359-1300(+)
MQPMMAMDTPGRWPVRTRMDSVTSCRSKSVRPHEGQLTYSVLVLRMRLPCSMPKEVVRRKSTSSPGFSMHTPSPRPSTSMQPSSEPPRMTTSSRSSSAENTLWWMTGISHSASARPSNTRREACMRLRPEASSTSSMAKSAAEPFRAARSSLLSEPSMVTAKRAAPAGRGMAPPVLRATKSLSANSATVLSMGVASSAAAGATTCTPTSTRRRSALRPASSSAGGSSRMKMLSEVAMSLKGMPTTSLVPSLRYSISGFLRSARVMADSTEPSRCSRLRKSTLSPSLCSGRVPVRRTNSAKLRRVSGKSCTPMF